MARDSRLWQNSLAHAKIFSGDHATCVLWYAWARQKLSFMLANHPGATSQVFMPVDGVVIRVDTRPNKITIASAEGGIYMESGFIDFVSTGKCTEAAYRPGTLNYNAKVIAELNSATPIQGKVKLKATDLPESPFTGELLADGSSSLAVGCKPSSMLPEIVTPDPCNVTYSNGGYCGLDLLFRKQAMQKAPASLYTGKLRLFIQAMYGSTRSDFTNDTSKVLLQDQSGKVYANPADGRIKLEHSGIGSYWLYTIGPGGYALCYFDGFNLHIIPLLLTDVAQKFAEALVGHPLANDFKFKTKVEAYLLAYAKPVYDSSLWTTIPVSGPSVLGDPLSYGWHTNWDGSEAHMVSFYADQPNNRFLSNQYKLTITKIVSSEGLISFSASMAITEANKPFNNWSTALHLFYYDEEKQEMMPVPKPTIFPPAIFNFDAPVYCTTRLDLSIGDCVLHTVRAYRSLTTPTSYYHIDNNPRYTFDDYVYEERKTYSGDAGQSGFKLVSPSGTTNYLGDWENLTAFYRDTRTRVGGAQWNVVSVGASSFLTGANPWYSGTGWSADSGYGFRGFVRTVSGTQQIAQEHHEHQYYSRVIEQEQGSVARDVKAFAEAPWLSCDSVIIGVNQTTTRSATYTINTYSTYGYKTRDVRMNERVYSTDAGGYVLTGNVFESASGQGINVHCNPTPDIFSGDPCYGASSPVSTVTQTAGSYYTTKIYDISGSEPASVGLSNSLAGDTRYFSPSASSPGTGTIDEVQTSIMSGAYSNHTLYDKDYGFIKNASVGWA